MKWLIWKEYRLNRLILILGAVILILPHAVALILTWRDAGPDVGGGVPRLSANLFMAGYFSLIFSQFTLMLLGGNAIACERVDRSAEFLACLPVSRARTLVAKLTLALATAALIWVPNLLVMLLAASGVPNLAELVDAESHREGLRILASIALVGFLSFSAGWLFSSMLESPTFAIGGGMVAPIVVASGIQGLAWAFELSPETLGPLCLSTLAVLAVASLAGGTWYYLRRVEP